MGSSSKSKTSKEALDQQRVIALHEAAHAVTAVSLGIKFQGVAVGADQDEWSGGRLELVIPKLFKMSTEDMSESQLEAMTKLIFNHVVVFLAGPCATFKATGRWDLFGAISDLTGAVAYLSRIATAPNIDYVMATVLSSVQDGLDIPRTWTSIEAVADALLEHGTLSAAKVKAICKKAA